MKKDFQAEKFSFYNIKQTYKACSKRDQRLCNHPSADASPCYHQIQWVLIPLAV